MFIAGTLFDDISMRGCIAQSECQCKHDKIYNSGEVTKQDRQIWYVRYFITMCYCISLIRNKKKI